jgi:hypothetical protein
VKLRVFGLILLLCLLWGTFPAETRAEKDTVMVGVDEDQLFAGAWFTVSPRWDLMASLYDNAWLGWGFDYHNQGRSFKVSREWHEIETAFTSPAGALHYDRNDSAGTVSGSANYNYQDLGVTGYYSTNEDSDTSGALNARWNGTFWRSLVHTAYRNNDDEKTNIYQVKNNYRVMNGWQTKFGTWSVDLQDNMFSEGSNYVIGEGAELAWSSPKEQWQIAYGQFHETKSDLTEDRLQLQWQDQRKKQFNQNSLGLDTKVTDYLYGNNENQQIGSLSGWWRYDFGPGSLKWNLENIWRGGTTPFEFDYEDEHSFYTGVVFDWQGLVCHSNFSIDYDLQDFEWRTVHGLLETPFWGWHDSLTANYNLETDYGDSDLVYLLLFTSPTQNFVVDQSFNHQFATLDTDLEWKLNFVSGDGLRMKFAYDCEDQELDDLLFEYRVVGVGKFTLTYDLDKPKVMLVYTWDKK